MSTWCIRSHSASSETHQTNVLLLELKHVGAPGICPGKNETPYMMNGAYNYSQTNQPFYFLAGFLEGHFGELVENRTGLTGRYNLNLHWTHTANPEVENEEIKQALLYQLGLELVPARQPVEMLVVKKLK